MDTSMKDLIRRTVCKSRARRACCYLFGSNGQIGSVCPDGGNGGGNPPLPPPPEPYIKKWWHPEIEFNTGFANGVVLDFGMPEGDNGWPWICARGVNGKVIKIYDHEGNFKWEKQINGGGDEHSARFIDLNGDGFDKLVTLQDNGLAVYDAVTGEQIHWKEAGWEFASIAVMPDWSIIVVDAYCKRLDKYSWDGSGFQHTGHFDCNGVIEGAHFPRCGIWDGEIIVSAGWFILDNDLNPIRSPGDFEEFANGWQEHCDGCWITEDGLILSPQGQNRILKYNKNFELNWVFQHPGTTKHYHNLRVDEANGRIMFTEELRADPRVFMIDMQGNLLPSFPIACNDQCQMDYFFSPDAMDIYAYNGLINAEGELFYPFAQEHEFWNMKQSYYGILFKAFRDGRVKTDFPDNDHKPNLVLSGDRKRAYQQSGHRG